MSRLHLVAASPYLDGALAACLDHALAGDAVLLIGDGVFAVTGRCAASLGAAARGGIAVYALAPDLAARGLASKELAGTVATVDYPGFVDLAAAHAATQSWF